MTRLVLVAAILALPVLAVLNAIWFGVELHRYVRRTPCFASTRDLDGFRHVVGRQMRAALVQIGLLVLPPVLFGIGLVRGVLDPSEVLLVVFPSAVVLLVAAVFKRIETAARRIPAVNPELQEERDRVIRTWVRRAVPDW